MKTNMQSSPREGTLRVENAEIYYREVGEGRPLIILHGGPDFDHNYLLPEMDRLADSLRVVYYDQRGRGKSGGSVRPEEITMESEIEDLERLRRHLGLESMAILGHSWGGLLAMEYATRHADRLSHLILLNTAPASREDYLLFQRERAKNTPDDIARMAEMRETAPYQTGDREADEAYYRVHFRAAIRRPEHLENLVSRLRANVTPEGILRSRRIEDKLMEQTWLVDGYDLIPKLEGFPVPTLIIHGDQDFCPAECAFHIAAAIPEARFGLLKGCGHFSYIDCPDQVFGEIRRFVM
jgi:proline iminopeptidase